jgi:hypothetical protein
MTAGRIVLG